MLLSVESDSTLFSGQQEVIILSGVWGPDTVCHLACEAVVTDAVFLFFLG